MIELHDVESRTLPDQWAGGAADRSWVAKAVASIRADQVRSADTHLQKLRLPGPEVDLYLKDESTHPTGSLKHRLARSLFLYHLCNGAIGPDTTLVEASSGSTAVSEAYFARMIGVPFVAVMPKSTSPSKVRLIEAEGGRIHLVDRADEVYSEAQRLASDCGGLYVDQFCYAERATDWRGNNNIAETIFDQMSHEPFPVPHWIVVGAGTGGTSATIGRFVRYRGVDTRLAVVDPEGSAFFSGYGRETSGTTTGSRIEGIGRPRMEASFVPGVVDRMLRIPDAASIAAMHFLRHQTGLAVGPSTGTNVYAALLLACEMRRQGVMGSIVTLICDRGDRYLDTYWSDSWIRAQGWRPEGPRATIDTAWRCGRWEPGPSRGEVPAEEMTDDRGITS